MYAAVAVGATLICTHGWDVENAQILLAPEPPAAGGPYAEIMDRWLGPVQCSLATSRSLDENARIHQFIKSSVGFVEMDRVITAAILEGASLLLDPMLSCLSGQDP